MKTKTKIKTADEKNTGYR